MAEIKPEGDDAHVKPEPLDPLDLQAPAADEEDLYEDAGDLEFYDPNADGNRFEALYLARLPKYLWDSWAKLLEGLDDDNEVRIGTLRTWSSQDSQGQERQHLRMLLEGHSAHQLVPVEYDLEVTDKAVQNHFIFSEEDLPGFKAKSKARADAAALGMPASLLRPKYEPQERRTYDRRSRYQPYYRKAVPKKTKIVGKIAYDMRVEPVDKREEERILSRKMFEAGNLRPGTQIVSRYQARKAVQSGTAQSRDFGADLVKAAVPPPKPKKGEHLKAARLPPNELRDLFFICFREFQYWSMKALRQRTQQPENYIRSQLVDGGIGVLHKSGPFANHYSLHPSYAAMIAGAEAKEAAAEEDDEDEGDEMEDVIPTA
ncbi:transcription initiation factor IIF, beta subunit domain-containing protein [Sarocladium implicatum]|nr:transcription initiation factor IIF, beta subunit domain-containing protein [Sarocladium implicatum]